MIGAVIKVISSNVSIAAPISKEINATKRNFPFNLISLSSDFRDSNEIRIPLTTIAINAKTKYNVIISPKSISTGVSNTPSSKGLINRYVKK